jgi:hypothetical protein
MGAGAAISACQEVDTQGVQFANKGVVKDGYHWNYRRFDAHQMVL